MDGELPIGIDKTSIRSCEGLSPNMSPPPSLTDRFIPLLLDVIRRRKDNRTFDYLVEKKAQTECRAAFLKSFKKLADYREAPLVSAMNFRDASGTLFFKCTLQTRGPGTVPRFEEYCQNSSLRFGLISGSGSVCLDGVSMPLV